MAKKKTNGLEKILTLVALLLGVVSLIMFFLPAIVIKDTETTYTGLQAIFGFKETIFNKEVVYLQFSFMNLLTLLFALAGVVFTVLNIMGKKCKLLPLGSVLAFLVAGVFFFLMVSFCVPNEGLESLVNGLASFLGQSASVKDALVLGIGAIIGGITSILASLSLAYVNFVKK